MYMNQRFIIKTVMKNIQKLKQSFKEVKSNFAKGNTCIQGCDT